MWSQFKDDVFHTEEMQIIDTIKLEILMNRILKSQHENQQEIMANERIVQNEKARDKDQRDVGSNYEYRATDCDPTSFIRNP